VNAHPAAPGKAQPKVTDAEQRTAKRIRLIWVLLFVNVLGGLDGSLIVTIPRAVGQVVTMGSLAAAFLLALRLNPTVRVRVNTFLVLLTALTVIAFVSSARLESGLGALFRCGRLAVFVTTLWLLSEWWRGDQRFLRLHLQALGAVLASVVAGALLVPPLAFSGAGQGRLVGVIWPIPPTQVGEYGAVAAGLAILLWLSHEIDGRGAAMIVFPGVACLLLSHTRTAIVGLIVGLSVASFTLFATSSRARRVLGMTITLGALVALSVPDVLLEWFHRDQSAGELAELTGRQHVWDALLARERTLTEQLFGIGLTDKSFNGLAIDSTWMSVYHELGLFGVAIVGAMLGCLLIAVFLRQQSPARRCALFLIVYCISASYTEVGVGDASPYLLHLAVATSLLLVRDPVGPETEFGAFRHDRTGV
jgi:hypothetical protein